MHWPEIEPGSPRSEAGNLPPEPRRSIRMLLKRGVSPWLVPAHNAKKGKPSLHTLLHCACVSESFQVYGTILNASASVRLSVTYAITLWLNVRRVRTFQLDLKLKEVSEINKHVYL
jgi:hypothetical protein